MPESVSPDAISVYAPPVEYSKAIASAGRAASSAAVQVMSKVEPPAKTSLPAGVFIVTVGAALLIVGCVVMLIVRRKRGDMV